MRRWIVLGWCLAFAGCGVDPDTGLRFRAERELYRANEDFRSTSIRPGLVGDETWRAIAERYEAIADRYADSSGEASAPGPVRQQIQTIAARALFSAAQVYGSRQDSTHVLAIFSRMEREFGHLPAVAGEVALAQGAIAEGRRDADEAVRYYQMVVDRVDPDPLSTGAAGAVLDLPLRIARLKVAAGAGKDTMAYYAEARRYYEDKKANHAGARVQIDAQTNLAQLAADLGDWKSATRALREVEADLLEQEAPSRDPAMIRYLIAASLSRGRAPVDSVEKALESVLADYPGSATATLQARSSLADLALANGRVAEALAQLDRIREENPTDEDVCSKTLLRKAGILEQDDERWSEALEAYRAVTVEHPITEAALQAPLEIARHYWRVEDKAAMRTALDRAEKDYRGFVQRYPPGPRSIFARERLVQTLMLREEFDPAIQEMLQLGEDLQRTRRGPELFITAAQVAFTQLADTTRAVTILDRAGGLYADAEIGRWATGEAARLKGLMTP